MGYSTSARSVAKVKKVLDRLVNLAPDEKLQIETSDAKRLTYALHEAFRTIKDNPTSYTQYVDVVDNFRVRNKGVVVFIEPKGNLIGDVRELTEAIKSLVVPDVSSMLQLIGAVTKHKVQRMTFPNAQLDSQELERFGKWCTSQGYSVTDIEPLTVQKVNGKDDPT